MRTKRLFSLVLALALLLGSILPVAAQGATSATGPESVVHWNRTAVALAVPGPPGSNGLVYLAYVQAAVYNAVAAIDGRYQQYKADLAPRPGASIDAAVATAAHDVLAYYFPGKQLDLAADLAASLGAIPDGTAKSQGIDVGQQAAAAIISLRQGDGREENIGFIMPTPGPGVWQLPPPPPGPLTPWLSRLRPFTMERPSQFRVGPPPDLTSAEWTRDFNEVKTMGRLDSPYRSSDQTKIARFWGVQPIAQNQATLAGIAEDPDRGLDAMGAARLFAMANLVGIDALIACWDAKYTYLFWRPFSAIPQADTDGNPATAAEPTWTALLSAPPHPEYPSAHSCLTGSHAEVLAEFFGTNRIDIDIKATLLPEGEVVTRHYDRVVDLQHEVMNARVWAGIHYRESTVKGVLTGRKVAHYALKRYFLPAE